VAALVGVASCVVIGVCALTPTAAAAAAPGDVLVAPVKVGITRTTATASLGSPAVIRHRELTLFGVPIRGAFETVRDTGDGGAVVAGRRPTRLPQLRPSQARVPAAALPARIAEALDLPTVPTPATAPELVYLMVLDTPVLAWEVDLPMTVWPAPDRRTVWMSAATGRLLQEQQHVFSSRTRAFLENPSKTPDPIEIVLGGLDVSVAGQPLAGTRLRSLNCVDEPAGDPLPWWDEGECYAQSTVLSDESGDFFVTLPDIIDVGDNVQPSDGYAEVSMYVHADRFLTHMASLGIPGFACEESVLVANFRALAPTSTLPFDPLNNAYFTGECDPDGGPTMLFGQGSDVDFGYDGDVVYHEMGHGIVAHVTPEGLGNRAKRADGFLLDARALNEFFADYLSLSLTGDPELAEYVGRFWASNARPYIRSAENERVCPDSIANQEHNDSEPMTAAMWSTRRQAPDPRGVDRLVLETLARLPSDATLDGAATTMLEVADVLLDEGTLDPNTVDVLVRALDARGLIDCPRIITDAEAVAAGKRFGLIRVNEAVAPFWPSPMQLRYEVPAGADDVVVRMQYRAGEPEDPLDPRILIKVGDSPIAFTYDLAAVDVPPSEPVAEGEPPPDDALELVLVGGDWDHELSPTRLTTNEYELRLGGYQPGEVVYVTVVNAATANANVSDLRVLSSAEFEEPPEETGGDVDPDDAPEEVAPGAVNSGCGCRHPAATTAGPSGASGLPWLTVLLLLGRRRRRRDPAGAKPRRRRPWPG
jgi:MYXO-CTERM domain-containing protein